MSQSDEKQQLDAHLVRSMVIPMIISAICQLITGVLLYVLGTISLLIRYDVLYWPPFMDFSLGNIMIWHVLAYFIAGFSLFQLIFAIILRIKCHSNKILRWVYPIAAIQILFVPVGTICAGLEFSALKSLKKGQDTSILDIKNEEQMHQEAGLIQIWAGIIHEGFLCLIFLLTVYLSTMMLDLTYPFLTMEILFYIRWGVVGFACIYGCQILIGWLYRTRWNRPIIRIFAIIFAIFQVLMLPIGTVACISTIRDVRQKKKLQ